MEGVPRATSWDGVTLYRVNKRTPPPDPVHVQMNPGRALEWSVLLVKSRLPIHCGKRKFNFPRPNTQKGRES